MGSDGTPLAGDESIEEKMDRSVEQKTDTMACEPTDQLRRIITLKEMSAHSSPEDCWLAIDGQVFDVTSWLGKHPGGARPILSSAGQDATDQFLAVHPKQVKKILPKFYVGDLEEAEVPALIQDYRKMRKQFEEEGLFELRLSFYYKQAAVLAALFGVVVAGVVWTSSPVVHLACAVLLGVLWNMCSFIGHDVGHNGVTQNRKIDSLIGLVAGNVMTGIGIGWWKSTHNVHHILCNSLSHDPDTQFLPIIALSSSLFHSIHSCFHHRQMTFDSVARALVSYQHLYFYPLMAVARVNLYLQSIFFLIAESPTVLEWAAEGIFFSWYFALVGALPSNLERAAFLLLSLGTSGILHLQICYSHFSMPMFIGRLEHDGFLHKQVEGTLDVDVPPWLDWFWGGLQFQIEHHLFPRLPRPNLRRISGAVEQFCAKHNLPFTKVSPWEANARLVRTLHGAAMEARDYTIPAPSLTKGVVWDALNARG